MGCWKAGMSGLERHVRQGSCRDGNRMLEKRMVGLGDGMNGKEMVWMGSCGRGWNGRYWRV